MNSEKTQEPSNKSMVDLGKRHQRELNRSLYHLEDQHIGKLLKEWEDDRKREYDNMNNDEKAKIESLRKQVRASQLYFGTNGNRQAENE